MKITIQTIVESNNQKIIQDVASIEREGLSAETLGLTLKEAKNITAGIQTIMATHQVADYISHERSCSQCGKLCPIKEYHSLTYRTLFGVLPLRSPRLFECKCQSQEDHSFSPLTKILSEHIAPELSYLESKWASYISYGMTVKILEEFLPLHIHSSSIFYNTHKVSTRLEKELGEEKYMYVEGCQREWENLPRPDTPLEVALDGGYVHAREGNNRKAGWFQVIVGKSLQDQQKAKRFGFVVDYDKKPKRRLYEMLMNQGLQMNQDITFLTDGEGAVRELPLYLSPQSEHIIDWFHITMRITVMKQLAKGVVLDSELKLEDELDRAKWYIWHGNVFRALQVLEALEFELDIFYDKSKKSKEYKLYQAVEEFYQYIKMNSPFITNYGERYRYGETISTAFAESTVNECISKRMVKKQQMRWTKKGAHLLLQVRIKALNQELRPAFEKWYPKMQQENSLFLPLAA